MNLQLFTLDQGSNTVYLAPTTVSSNVALSPALPSPSFRERNVIVTNEGSVTVHVAFGDNTVTALPATVATPGTAKPVLPGATESFNVGGATYMAAATKSGAGAVYATCGTGA